MSFNEPAFLFLSAAALIPWIFYFLQRYRSETVNMPSLIFLFESRRRRIKEKTRLLIYLLHSLVLLLPGIILAEPGQSAAGGRDCIVDDLPRARWSAEMYNRLKTEYSPLCNHFYSAAALSENRIEEVSDAVKGATAPLEETLNLWHDKLNDAVFITARDNGLSDKSSVPAATLYRGADNIYFRNVQLKPHPFDFRKRILEIETSHPGQKFSLERAEGRMMAATSDQGHFRTTLTIRRNSGAEVVRVRLWADDYITDNTYYLMLHEKPFYSVSLNSRVPASLKAVFLLGGADFPFFWFSSRHSPGAERLRFSEQHGRGGLQITVPSGSEKRPGTFFLEAENEVFSKYPVQTAYRVDNLPEQSRVTRRFTDGTPAVTSTAYGAVFHFDPDSVSRALLRHPAYPQYVLETLLAALQISDSIETDSLTQLARVSDARVIRQGFTPGIYSAEREYTEPGFIKDKGPFYILNFSPEASEVTGVEIAQTRYQSADSGPVSSYLWFVFLALLSGSVYLRLKD